MNAEDKFRKDLKDLVDSREFPFEENDWDRASVYLARQRGARRLRIAAIAILLISSVAGMLYFLNDKLVTDKHIAVAPVKQEAVSKSEASEVEKTFNTVDQSSMAEPENISATKERSKKSATTKRTVSEKNHTQSGGRTSVPAVQRSTGKTHISLEKQVPAGEIAVTEPSSGRADDIKEIPPQQTASEILLSGSDHADPETAVGEISGENPAVTSPVTPIVVAPDSAAVPETAETEIGADTTGQKEIAVTNTESPDTATKHAAKMNLEPVLSLEAGLSLHQGWNAGGKEGSGASPYGGIHYLSPLSEKMKLSFGIQYQRINGLSAYTHTSATTRLSFGEEREVTEITPQQLHYVAVPLRLLYSLNENNQVGAGYQLAYLLDVQSQVQTYSIKNNEKTSLKNYSSRGYTDGFAIFDSQLSLLYRWQAVRRVWLQADLHFGLSDIKGDGFFPENGSQRSSGIRFGIIFDLKQ